MWISRRDILRLFAAGAAMPVSCVEFQEKAPEADPYGGFRMSVATYSLRKFPLERALEEIKKFGLHTAEINPLHLPIDSGAEKLRQARALLEKHGIQAHAFGVFYTKRHSKDVPKAIRDVFALAKALGVRVLSSDLEAKWIGAVEEQAVAHDIRIGLHNHGPKSLYDKLADVQKALDGRDARLGATVDLGHYMRSGEDPVNVIQTLGKRVHGVHLKDIKEGKPAVLGAGELDLKGVLKALKDVKYEGALSLEYEERADDPFDDMRQCLAAVRECVDMIK